MVTAARWAKPAARSYSLRDILSQRAFIRDFLRIASGGGRKVVLLRNRNADIMQHS